MKYTEQQIRIIAETVLSDLDEKFDPNNIESLKHFPDETIEYTNEVKSVWVVYVVEQLFDSMEFLFIDDLTGEPIYYRTHHSGGKIKKDNIKGKYVFFD